MFFSPSNMGTFMQCPLRFYAQSVSKEMPWKPSKAKGRGTRIHSNIEKCIRLGWQEQVQWDSGIDLSYVRARVAETMERRNAGYQVAIEKELAIDKNGLPCDWWADNGLLRAKADMIMTPKNLPEDSPVYLIDIKTGRRWDDEDFQLRVECLLAHIVTGRPVTQYEYWYVDEGETFSGYIDFRNGLAPVQDIYDLIREMLLALRNNDFPTKRNKFCKWCDWHGTPRCR